MTSRGKKTSYRSLFQNNRVILLSLLFCHSSWNSAFIPCISSFAFPLAYFAAVFRLVWRGGGQGGGSPGEQGAGGVRETGEERAGGGISTMAGSGREFKKASFCYLLLLTSSQRNEPKNVSWLPFNVFRGLQQNCIHEKRQKTKIGARDEKKKCITSCEIGNLSKSLTSLDMNEIAWHIRGWKRNHESWIIITNF